MMPGAGHERKSAQTEAVSAKTRYPIAPVFGSDAVTDLRLHRVWVTGGINGIHLYNVLPS
jgi:hypothetical protein